MGSSTINKERTAVRGIGEIALRVNNLDVMQKFYEEVIGLPLMARVPDCAFFKVADGYGGHTQVLALFDRSRIPGYRGTDAATSTIDHVAFEIAWAADVGWVTHEKDGAGLALGYYFADTRQCEV